MKRTLVLIPLCLILLPAVLPGQTAASASPRQVYVAPFSHLDFFWGGTREECLARGNQIIAKAVEIAGKHPEFRFLIEDEDFVANYVESHLGMKELEDLKALVKQGRIEISPKWAAIFQELPDGEVHVRNFQIGKHYARSVFGVDPLTAHLGDLPGYIPQFPQIMRRSAVPYAVMTRMGPKDRALFRWKSPDGSTAITWFSWKGYGYGSKIGLQRDISPAQLQALEKDLRDVEATTDGPILIHWGSDLWAPTDKLIDSVAYLNRATPNYRFAFTTPKEFFERLPNPERLVERDGEIPSSWPNIVSSLPHLWPLVIPATNTLLTAEKFAAINYALGYSEYPGREFEFLWRKLIESMDHNHDGQGGGPGDERKRSYSEMAIVQGGEILRDRLRNIAERVEIPFGRCFPIVVFNPLSWQRSDVVKAHLTLYGEVSPRDVDDYRKGMRLVDEKDSPIPFHVEQYSENISRALDITFIARDVPSVGYKTYYLRPAGATESTPVTAQLTFDSDQDHRDPRRPTGADTMENAFYRVTIDKPTGRVTVFDKALGRDIVKNMEMVGVEERGGNYIGIEPVSGRTIPGMIDRIVLEENNLVRAVMKLSGQVAGVPVTQRLILYRDAKRLDIENSIEWNHGPQVRIQQLFPYQIPNAEVRYGLPFGSNTADHLMANTGPYQVDEITQESWLKARHIQDWIHAGTPEYGFTVASDHQLMKLDDGLFRAEMVRGVKFTSVKVVREDQVGSMDYPPPGTYVCRYSLVSGAGDWKAVKAYRTGMSFNQPLIPVSVVDYVSRKMLPPSQSLLSVDGDNLVVSSLKKLDSGPGIALRFFEYEGSPANTTVRFLGKVQALREVNMLEEDLPSGEQSGLAVRPYEIRTVRLPAGR
jgi:alpha-mannosidase